MKNKFTYDFSDKSKIQLATCDPRLQLIAGEAIKFIDFTVLQGHRSDDEQEALFKENKSLKRPGESKHNLYPSMAMDIAPFPIDFNYLPQFYYLAGIIMTIAWRMGIKIRWGGCWSGDFSSIKSNSFNDLGHFEIMEDQ